LHRRILDLANPPQLIAQDLCLGVQLFLIGQVLVMTSTTNTEMLAARKDPIRRCLEDFHQPPTRIVALLLRQPDAHALARQPEWDEDRASIFEATHRISAIGQLLKLEVYRFRLGGHFC
jgi:hypothetical protein